MDTLNKIVRKYLDENGISDKFFEEYIGCSQPMCSKWFKGERKLNREQLQKTHEFLSGKHIKTVEDILKGGIVIITVSFDDDSYSYLIRILDEKYYSTTDISELQKLIVYINFLNLNPKHGYRQFSQKFQKQIII